MLPENFELRIAAAQEAAELRAAPRRFDLSDIEIREDGDTLQFIGHAAVFDRLSEDLGGFRERIKRGAFRRALDASPDVRFLINHEGLPLARTTNGTLELREDPKGLRVYAELAPIQASRDLAVLVRRGDVSQMSFAFSVDSESIKYSMENDEVVREIQPDGMRGLFDVSAVTYPAYPQTDGKMRSVDPELDSPDAPELDGVADATERAIPASVDEQAEQDEPTVAPLAVYQRRLAQRAAAL